MKCEEKHITFVGRNAACKLIYFSFHFSPEQTFPFFNFHPKTFCRAKTDQKRNEFFSYIKMLAAVSNRKQKEEKPLLSLLESFNFKQKQNKLTQQRHHHHCHHHFPENYKVYSLKKIETIYV